MWIHDISKLNFLILQIRNCDLTNCICDIPNWSYDVTNSISWYQKLGSCDKPMEIRDITNRILDITTWILDITNWICDIRNYLKFLNYLGAAKNIVIIEYLREIICTSLTWVSLCIISMEIIYLLLSNDGSKRIILYIYNYSTRQANDFHIPLVLNFGTL